MLHRHIRAANRRGRAHAHQGRRRIVLGGLGAEVSRERVGTRVAPGLSAYQLQQRLGLTPRGRRGQINPDEQKVNGDGRDFIIQFTAARASSASPASAARWPCCPKAQDPSASSRLLGHKADAASAERSSTRNARACGSTPPFQHGEISRDFALVLVRQQRLEPLSVSIG